MVFKKHRSKYTSPALGGAIAVLVLAGLIAWSGFEVVSGGDGSSKVSRSRSLFSYGKWNKYENKKFGFTLEYPAGWEVYEGNDPYVPVINIYPPIVSSKPPFDQTTDVVSVSIFPQGIRNALILSQSKTSDLETLGAVGKKTSFTLSNGDVWAWQFIPENPPMGWKPWGFVWARAKVSNLSFGCLRKDKEIPYEDCDPNGGDDVIRQGSLDTNSANTVEKILESFSIISTSTPLKK